MDAKEFERHLAALTNAASDYGAASKIVSDHFAVVLQAYTRASDGKVEHKHNNDRNYIVTQEEFEKLIHKFAVAVKADGSASVNGELMRLAYSGLNQEVARYKHRENGYIEEMAAVEEHLGRALGYNTDCTIIGGLEDEVMVGDHTPGTLAAEAATKIQQLRELLREADKLDHHDDCAFWKDDEYNVENCNCIKKRLEAILK